MISYIDMEREAKRKLWNEKIHEWEESGLNATAWCKKKEINYGTFKYWKAKFKVESLESHPMIELVDESSATGIEIEVKGIVVHISRNFDMETMKRLISVVGQC